MQLTEYIVKGRSQWIDLYGNPYKKCCKCGKQKPDYELCKDKNDSLGLMALCKNCQSNKDRIRMQNPIEKEKSKQRVNKFYTIKRERNRLKKSLSKRYPQTKIYIRKCVLTDKLFVTTHKTNYHIVNCGVKGDFKSEWNCYLSVKKYGSTHNCVYCNNSFDMRVSGYLRNISNKRGATTGKFCSKECIKKYSKQSITESARRRRARLRTGVVETIRPEQIYIRDKYKCWICGCNVVSTYGKDNCRNNDAATIDHVIPLAKGGTHTKENLKTACRQCNSIKSDSIISGTQINIFTYASG